MAKPFRQTFVGKAILGDEWPVAVFLRRMFSAGLLAKVGAVLGAVAGAAFGLHVGLVAAGGALLFGGATVAVTFLSRKTVKDCKTPREKLKVRFNKSLPLALSTAWVMGTSLLFLPGVKKEFNEKAQPDKSKVEIVQVAQRPHSALLSIA